MAGLFYPAEGPVLSKTLEGLLQSAPPHYVARLRALICPHAGYEYSGRTAAIGYRTVIGRDIDTVVILAPSHYAAFDGVAIPNVDAYRTPLGLVQLSDKAKTLAAIRPFVLEPRCRVQRPAWWRQAPISAPEPGQDAPDTWEHSGEVQVPFLQRVLDDFKIVPAVFGEANPEQAGAALAKILDDKTLVVASSDLSHFHSYDQAAALDTRCVKAICSLDAGKVAREEACGQAPILALLHLARLKGWKAQLLDYRNSGDVTPEKERVVGYAAVAFYAPGPEDYTEPERRFLLDLARRALASAATNGQPPEAKAPEAFTKLSENRACFVTLTKGGALRGCIGHIVPQMALSQAVIENARNAALRDQRFPPVQAEEVGRIKIEISVLTKPQPLAFTSPEDLLAKLRPFEDGVLLQIGERGATFLPQVWAQIPRKAEFLSQLSLKAGCAPAAWRGKETTVSIYHVECFEEH